MRPALLALFLTSCIHFPDYGRLVDYAPDTPSTTLVDVAIFDGLSDSLLEHQDVTLAAGVIARVAPTGAPAEGEVIDGRGHTLLPGLIDFHAHTSLTATPPWYLTFPEPRHNLEAHVFAGVTTIVDMGGDWAELATVRAHIAADDWIGPRVFFAGPMFTAAGGYPVTMLEGGYGWLAAFALADKVTTQLDDQSQVESLVRERWAAGARFVKVIVASLPPGAPRLDEATLRRIVRAAHAFGLKVAAHIDTAEDALLAARAGIDVLAHGVETSILDPAQAAEICQSGISVVPTLVNYQRFDEIAARHYVGSEIERLSEPPELLAAFSDDELRDKEMPESMKPWADALVKFSAARGPNALKLYQAGCRILTGSDSMGSIAAFAGGIHDELRLLVAAGLPAATVLRSATSTAARFIEPGGRFGVVQVGAIADLLLVRGDPLARIEATRDIAQVFLRGRRVERTPR